MPYQHSTPAMQQPYQSRAFYNLRRLAGSALVALLALLLAACASTAHYPINPASVAHDPSKEYRLGNLEQGDTSNSLALVMTFSGGGTRAAALAHGVLEEMAEMQIQWDGKKRVLLKEIDAISGVSGGGITAAHYALKQERHFEEFPKQFLYYNFQQSIIDSLFSLSMLSDLASATFGRIEIMADKLDRNLYKGASYGDLVKQRKRPYIVLNATDMSSGAHFPFTQDQFDIICGDLNAIPLARAVAASAAVPVVFSPLTLKNYASTCTRPIHQTLERPAAALSPRQQQRLQELRSYRDDKRRPYLHLVDGGLADNMGVWGSFDSSIFSGNVLKMVRDMGADEVAKVLIIVVAAETDPTLDADLSPNVPSIRRVAQAFADIPINHMSRESLIAFREKVSSMQKEISASAGKPVDFYLVEVSLRDIADPAERERYMRIPTTLYLPADDVDDLRKKGREMLRQSPQMQRFLRDTAPATAPEASAPAEIKAETQAKPEAKAEASTQALSEVAAEQSAADKAAANKAATNADAANAQQAD